MKSQQVDQKIKTNCKDCAFAIYNENTQTSCAFDRISKFGEDAIEGYDNDKEFYVIDRLCTYYRNTSWGYSKNDIDKVQKESALGFDLIFDCNNINSNQVQIISYFLNNNKYYDTKLNITLLHNYENYSTVKDSISSVAKNSDTKINITVCENIENHMHQLLLKSKNGYHCFIRYPELLETNMLHKLNNYVNTDLNKLIVANVNGIEFISNFIYKIFNNMHNNHSYFQNIGQIIKDCKDKNMYIEI